ncbi:MAG: succinate dehydrogenase cytochrome b subunit [Myxococcota bacterium]
MRWVARLVGSSIGMKALMALTGVILVGFLVGHMIGNWQIFAGQDTLNAYGAFLHARPGALWAVRIGLLGTLLIHIGTSVRLTRLNKAARPIGYRVNKAPKSTLASRHMMLSGSAVFAFLVYHLLHFTVRVTDPVFNVLTDAQGRHDVYSMVVLSFRNNAVALTYVIAMVLLGFHLSHAISSMFQSMGLHGQSRLVERIGPIVATILVVGNIVMPLAVQFSFINLPPGAP